MKSGQSLNLLTDSSNKEEQHLLNLTKEYALNSIEQQNVCKRKRDPNHSSVNRDCISGRSTLYNDYFADTPVYTDAMFRRRFRMRRPLFLKIVEELQQHDDFFVQKRDTAPKFEFSSIEKVTAAVRLLSYGFETYYLEEYLRMPENTGLECLKFFCLAVIDVYGEEYLRPVTKKQKKSVEAQEVIMKDVEHAFNVIQAKFAIIRQPSHSRHDTDLKSAMKACIILHNMIVEDDRKVKKAKIASSSPVLYEDVPPKNLTIPREAEYGVEEYMKIFFSLICNKEARGSEE